MTATEQLQKQAGIQQIKSQNFLVKLDKESSRRVSN